MATRTALELSREEWLRYRPDIGVEPNRTSERWERAWSVAQAAAEILRRRFGATRVVAFGSIAHRDWFTPWSDIDLAAWGIPPDSFYKAVAAVTGISPEFKVDVVAPEDCQPDLRKVIEQEGIGL